MQTLDHIAQAISRHINPDIGQVLNGPGSQLGFSYMFDPGTAKTVHEVYQRIALGYAGYVFYRETATQNFVCVNDEDPELRLLWNRCSLEQLMLERDEKEVQETIYLCPRYAHPSLRSIAERDPLSIECSSCASTRFFNAAYQALPTATDCPKIDPDFPTLFDRDYSPESEDRFSVLLHELARNYMPDETVQLDEVSGLPRAP